MFSSIYHYVSFTGGHAETTGADGDIPCWYKSVLPARPGNALIQIISCHDIFRKKTFSSSEDNILKIPQVTVNSSKQLHVDIGT